MSPTLAVTAFAGSALAHLGGAFGGSSFLTGGGGGGGASRRAGGGGGASFLQPTEPTAITAPSTTANFPVDFIASSSSEIRFAVDSLTQDGGLCQIGIARRVVLRNGAH
jgi:hypothetical protein